MVRTWTAASLAVFLLLGALAPHMAQAAPLSYSTHKVLMAQEPTPDQPTEEEAAPAAATGKKNIGKGVMFSLIIPGAGQLYSGSWVRAIPWFAVEVVSWAMFAKYHGDGKDKTTEFENYAGPRRVGSGQPQLGHFDVNAYLYREYQIASSEQYNTAPYNGNLADWSTKEWDDRQEYFQNVEGFTHDVLTPDLQQYYEMIGKYLNQFGFGWIDWLSQSVQDGYADDGIYDYGLLGTGDDIWPIDDQSSVNFDFDHIDQMPAGYDPNSAHFYRYRDMRGEANDLLDKGNLFMEVVLVNHVLSSLDAAFAVRRFNKKLEQSPMGDLKLQYDARRIDGEMARFLTLSLPLDKP